MLSAYDDTGQLINLVDGQVPKGKRFSCPVCQQALILRQGTCYRPHFAHKQLRDCFLWQQDNESAEHLGLKAYLYQALSKEEEVRIEVPLPTIKQVADLMVNDQLVLEVQCSPLSLNRLSERTQAYRDLGYQVLWLLGEKLWLKDRLSQLQKAFLSFSQNMGFYLWELDYKAQTLRLKYLIHEDLEGKVHYLSQSFHLAEVALSCFRKPFCQQRSASLVVKQNPAILTYIQKQLYYKNKYWLTKQGEAYQLGDNLLTKAVDDFYPQVRPPAEDSSFVQIQTDLRAYYQWFDQYYQAQTDKRYQTLHPPAYLQVWCQTQLPSLLA